MYPERMSSLFRLSLSYKNISYIKSLLPGEGEKKSPSFMRKVLYRRALGFCIHLSNTGFTNTVNVTVKRRLTLCYTRDIKKNTQIPFHYLFIGGKNIMNHIRQAKTPSHELSVINLNRARVLSYQHWRDVSGEFLQNYQQFFPRISARLQVSRTKL